MHSARLNIVNEKPIQEQNSYVLYWMTSARRTEYNFALDHAIATANKLGKGLVVFEGLRQDYRWACDRFHAFIQEGMIENQAALLNSKVTYIPCIETPETPIKEIFWALAENSCLIISELYPAFFFPKMHRIAASQTSVQFRLVDTNGIYPLSESERIYTTAASFRRHLQKTIHPFLNDFPKSSSINTLEHSYTPSANDFTEEVLNLFKQELSSVDIQTLPIDHSISPVKDRIGGQQQARLRLKRFLAGFSCKRQEIRQTTTRCKSTNCGLSYCKRKNPYWKKVPCRWNRLFSRQNVYCDGNRQTDARERYEINLSCNGANRDPNYR
jgi:deoxyribodipyrimidine photo-lyase